MLVWGEHKHCIITVDVDTQQHLSLISLFSSSLTFLWLANLPYTVSVLFCSLLTMTAPWRRRKGWERKRKLTSSMMTLSVQGQSVNLTPGIMDLSYKLILCVVFDKLISKASKWSKPCWKPCTRSTKGLLIVYTCLGSKGILLSL